MANNENFSYPVHSFILLVDLISLFFPLGMRAFISAEHRSHFESFLASHMGSSAGGGGGSGEKQRRGKRTSAGPPRLGREESNDNAAALSPLTAASPPPPPPPPPAPAPPKEPATVDDVLSSIQNEMEELELSLT